MIPAGLPCLRLHNEGSLEPVLVRVDSSFLGEGIDRLQDVIRLEVIEITSHLL